MLQELENVKVEGVEANEEILKTKIRFGSKGLTIWAQSPKLEEFFKAKSAGVKRDTAVSQDGSQTMKVYRVPRMDLNDVPGAEVYGAEPLYWLVSGSRNNYAFLLLEGLSGGVAVTVNSPITKSDFDRWVKGLKDVVKHICLNYLQEYEVDLVIYEKSGRR